MKLLNLATETWPMQTNLIPGTVNLTFRQNGIVSKALQEQDCQLNVLKYKINHIQYG